MVIGLLVLSTVPTVTGVSEAIAQRNKLHENNATEREERELRHFGMYAWCGGDSRGKREVHKGTVVVGKGQLWVQSSSFPSTENSFHAFEGFFVEYPDPGRVPPELGLVVQASYDPPLLNWVYVDGVGRIRYGNRTESKPHAVGTWGTTNDLEEPDDSLMDGKYASCGGLVFEGQEKFVAVEPDPSEDSRRWAIWWDEKDNRLHGLDDIEGKLVLRISLERKVELPENDGKPIGLH